MRRAGWLEVVAGTLAVVVLAGCAGSTGRAAKSDASATAAGTKGATSAGAAAEAGLVPPDGRWLRDDDGREYFVQRLEMPPGTYAWSNPERTRARLRYGLEADVVAHDASGLSIKIYRSEDDDEPAAPRSAPAPDAPSRRAPVAAAGDPIRVARFDQGLPESGQWRNGFDVADVDGDGQLDIVFGPPRKSRRPPTVFRGDGSGHWSVWGDAAFPALPFDYGDAAVADLNGDGHADVVLASHLRGIVALVGDGRGGFTVWSEGVEFALPGGKEEPAFSSRAIEIVDWNGDGRPDILALGEGPTLALSPGRSGMGKGSRGSVVYLNGGDGRWTKVARAGSGSFGSALAVADLNGDGRTDFATGSDRRGFRALVDLAEPDGGWREVEIAELAPGGLHRAVASADFDRDGRADLAVSFVGREGGVERNGIDVLLARGAGWQRETVALGDSSASIQALATGDLDGDGAPDLVGGDETGRLVAVLGDGRGGFVRAPLDGDTRPPGCRIYAIRLVNLDGARGDEIVVAAAGEGESDVPGAPACASGGSLSVLRAVGR